MTPRLLRPSGTKSADERGSFKQNCGLPQPQPMKSVLLDEHYQEHCSAGFPLEWRAAFANARIIKLITFEWHR